MEVNETTGSGRPPARSRRWRAIGGVALLALLAGGGVWLWEEILEDRFIPKRWGVVEEGKIYRSGQLSPQLVGPVLEEHGIRRVIDLTNGGVPGSPESVAEAKAVEEQGIEYYPLALAGDGTGDIREYARAVELIDEAVREEKPVLVHCAAGSQRTGGAVAAYRTLVQGRSPREVFEEMQEYDWRPGKDRKVIDFLNRHMEELTRLLVEKGVLEEPPEDLPVLLAEEP